MDYLSFSQDISSAGWERRLFPDSASPHFSSGCGTNKTQTIKMGLALKRGSNGGETFYTNHIMNYGGMESTVKSSARMAIPSRMSKPSPASWIWESQTVHRKYLRNNESHKFSPTFYRNSFLKSKLTFSISKTEIRDLRGRKLSLGTANYSESKQTNCFLAQG